MTYATPVKDMIFLLEHAADFEAVRRTGAFEDVSHEMIEAVMTEAAKLADNVFAPLNQVADEQGARLENGQVFTTPGFKEAYAQYVEGGWNGLPFPEEYGGQGLPTTLSLLVFDALCGGCLGLAMGFSLTTGAVKALLASGTDEQRENYLPKLVSGEWTGTMNLSEPQAGSDLAGIKTKAEPAGDGQYKIKGQKVWISYGDHDLTDNICHLVLARLPDAPEGTRGISMFLVPKFRVKADGSLGDRNDITVVGIEEKLGQHGSPTCVLSYGDNDDCYGTLVGEENRGLANMFVMMNAARLDVGAQVLGPCDRSFQDSLAYARDRRQGRAWGIKTGDPVPIIEHPDVQRNLMLMRSLTDAGRAICYATAVAYDVAHHGADPDAVAKAKEREELLTPIAKSFPSDHCQEITNLGIQIFGGMGFVEETGVAQYFRDTRIASIYEGTNGIQAIDLVGRKLGMDGGRLAEEFIDEVEALAADLCAAEDDTLAAIGAPLARAADGLRQTTDHMVSVMAERPEEGLAAATAYQSQFGFVAGAFYLARAAKAAATNAASGEDADWHRAKVETARFYADNVLPRTDGLLPQIMAGSSSDLDAVLKAAG